MNTFPKLVIPAVATLGVLYPTSFLVGMWQSAENGDLDAPGTQIASAEFTSGFNYSVFERHFPHTYRLDMSSADQGFGTLCVLEVRNGPRPVSVAPGVGNLVHVTLEEPLPGSDTSRVTIDLTEAMRARCAAVVTEGQLYAGGAARNEGAAVQSASASPEPRPVTTLTPINGGAGLPPAALQPADMAGM